MGCVVVTGASRGIGREIAQGFGRKHNAVACIYKEKKTLALETVDHIIQSGGQGIAVQADVSDPQSVEAAFERIKQEFGTVDILINNAGVDYYGLLQDMTYTDWRNVFNVNVDGMFLCTKTVLPGMIQRRKGVILNMSSIWGSHAAAMECAYAASKGAVEAFTRSLAAEVAACGVRVNALAPGVVDTDMMHCLSSDDCDHVRATIPMGRFASCSEIAGYVSFLCSAEAAYLTGQIIKPAGGFVV